MSGHVLTLNAGSSSLKFGLYAAQPDGPRDLMTGLIERIGDAPGLKIEIKGAKAARDLAADAAADHAGALAAALQEVHDHFPEAEIRAVGHRVVHGGPDHDKPALLTDALLETLATYSPFAPLHQPHNLAGVRAARLAFPDAAQVACFDTAFHRAHPWVADAFALPRAWYEKGVRRYGFHGLSYDYVSHALARAEPELAEGRVIIAHLGNGASMCAVKNGRSIASTMGFSAVDGLPMGTRCGQLDPGVLLYFMDQQGMSPQEITDLLYKKSGLLGLSGLSNDMRTLMESDAPEAAQAIDYYVHRIRREIGALSAALGGLDALVFSGGVGENAAPIRARLLDGMGWIGLTLNAEANAANARRIDAGGKVAVLVIPTDEEIVIARAAVAALA